MKTMKCTLYLLMATIIGLQTTHAQTQKGLDIDGEAPNDVSGFSVSMPDAATLAIGASYNDGNGSNSGHVRIYEWNGSAWVQKGLDMDGEAPEDLSGFSVSMPDANTVAIGAPLNDGNGNSSGHVRFYEWNGSVWVQKGVDLDGEAAGDRFGWSVSMPDANTAAIGATFNDGNGANSGHVRVYEWNGIAWTQKGIDINGEAANDDFGYSVSMPDVNTIAIGAAENDGNGSNAGHARIYEWNGSAWIQKGVDIDGEGAIDRSGYSVSMPDANTVAIGARGNDGNGGDSGHVRIYAWNGSAWVQKGVDIDGEAVGDASGHSVSMPDANTVAIGARSNNGNGSDAGHVRIYAWNGSTWLQKGVDIDGEAADDESGWSVSMPDANTVAIGARENSGNGSNSGHVRVYDLCVPTSGTDIQTACDSYIWMDGNTYTSSNNTATFTLTNSVGCDSVVTLDLTINNSSTGTDIQTACDSYTWIDGNTYTSSNNSATFTLTNSVGCDSVVTLDLTINNSNTGVDVITACDSYTWIDGITYTASNNIATHTLTNAAGCDSVVTLDLTINTVDVTVTNVAPTLTANATGAAYQWLDCDDNFTTISGETSQSFIAAENGNYAVELTQNGCTDTSACEAVANVGLEVIAMQNLIVYPNPSSGIFVIEIGLPLSNISMIDMTGRLMPIDANLIQKTVNASNLDHGTYIIKVVTENNETFIKTVQLE